MTVNPNRHRDTDRPWDDPEILHRLYWHEEMTQSEIGDYLGCGTTTVGAGMREHSVPRRTMLESANKNTPDYTPLSANYYHYPLWDGPDGKVYVHRLMAVAEHGFEAVADNHVHHGAWGDGPNELPAVELPWANWPGNLEVLSNSEHQTRHKQLTGVDRLRIAELYEHGDISSRDLADQLPWSSGTVLQVHKEFYGDDSE